MAVEGVCCVSVMRVGTVVRRSEFVCSVSRLVFGEIKIVKRKW